MVTFRIKELCKEKSITQKELAEKIGISAVGLAKAIAGNTTIGTLERIADALNVPITELFNTGTDEELTALIHHNGDFYRATTIAELEEIVEKIKEKH